MGGGAGRKRDEKPLPTSRGRKGKWRTGYAINKVTGQAKNWESKLDRMEDPMFIIYPKRASKELLEIFLKKP